MKINYLIWGLIFISGCASRTTFVEISDKTIYYEYWIIVLIVFIFLFIFYNILRRL